MPQDGDGAVSLKAHSVIGVRVGVRGRVIARVMVRVPTLTLP